jgi:signal transduction histidine kinase
MPAYRHPMLEQAHGAWRRWRACQLADRVEARERDRDFRRDIWRWLGVLVLAVLVGTAVRRIFFPATAWLEAVTDAFAVSLWLLVLVAMPWYHYRRLARHSWAVFSTVIILGVFGASALFLLVAAANHPERAAGAQRWLQTLGTSILIGVVTAAVTLSVSRLRMREATRRMAAEAEHERMQRQSIQAELKLLQAQVEPHFLFNTLANVRQLMQSGSRDALPMLDHLIDYLRRALPDLRSDASTLGREADLAQAYLEIMRMRMGGGLRFTIAVPSTLREHPFPPLMLMTLVENAVKHGVAPVGRGEVRISAVESEGRLTVCVIDDGRGLGGAIGQGVGLANVRERLRALHGEGASLRLESAGERGTVALLEMPA